MSILQGSFGLTMALAATMLATGCDPSAGNGALSLYKRNNTNMPGDGIYGAIMEASIVNYGNGVIYAHEFGHYLGLDHVGDTSDLMNAIVYTTSTKLTSGQCQAARDTASSYWSAMYRK